MCCVGGCVGGPAAIVNAQIAKGRMFKENLANKAETIGGSLDKNSFDGVMMHVVKKEETNHAED
jgi:iron only hydrogenase large subunit-like protein